MKTLAFWLVLSLLAHLGLGWWSGSAPQAVKVETPISLVFVSPAIGGPVVTATSTQGAPSGTGKSEMPTSSMSRTVAPEKIHAWGNRLPEYPEAAIDKGWEGQALLRLHLAADGFVERVELRESSGRQILDQAALSAARTWRIPETETSESWVEVPVAFTLTNED